MTWEEIVRHGKRLSVLSNLKKILHKLIVVGDTLVSNWMNILLNWIKPNKILNKFLNWIFREKILLNKSLNWIFLKKLYWVFPWIESYPEMNEWIIFWIDICHFWWKAPFFCLFWTLFGQFLGNYPIRPELMIPWLLNWIIFWIESADFFLNWIIFWIESWVKQYWIEYWMNHFLAKFKHWIESDWVSPTTTKEGDSPRW